MGFEIVKGHLDGFAGLAACSNPGNGQFAVAGRNLGLYPVQSQMTIVPFAYSVQDSRVGRPFRDKRASALFRYTDKLLLPGFLVNIS